MIMYDLFTNAGNVSGGAYYNTTSEKGQQLEIFALKAEKQDLKVLAAFVKYKRLTPSNCLTLVFLNVNVPLTSVRRSITNLTKAGKLIKTNEKAIGIYGRPEYIWQIV